MKIKLSVLLSIVASASLFGAPAPAATPEQIDAAVAKARDYLYVKQKDGTWEIAPEFRPMAGKPPNQHTFANADWGGLTAIATHALLAAGENPNDPRLKGAIDLLLTAPTGLCPYVICQRDQVLELLPARPAVVKMAKQDGQFLFQDMRVTGEASGLYYYFPAVRNDTSYDHSVSQYGVLGMWACGETGYEVQSRYWETVERGWLRHQDASGGWSYVYKAEGGHGATSASMTAAGVATLFITQDYVHSMEGLTCKGNVSNPAIDKGMKWLSDNFDLVYGSSPVTGDVATYTLYGIERIGVAGGYKYFGPHDWFKEGADWLLKHQNADGSWGNPGSIGGWNSSNIPATCFAIFFLTRGREPIAFNKISYDVMEQGKREGKTRWNQRPRDIAKLTRWMEKKTERHLNWHVVGLKDTPADELQDAPILYLSGDRPLTLAPEDEAKLKQFVEAGGMILGNPDGNAQPFIQSFKQLAARLFPTYEMRTLPPEHPIYTHGQFRDKDIQNTRRLLSVSNGVRELMLIPINDFAKSWQADLVAQTDDFRIPSNIYFYAMGTANAWKGAANVITADPKITGGRAVKVARLDYGGNSDPEPGGWRRMAALLHNEDQIDIDLQTIKLGAGKLNGGAAPVCKLAHLTGTAKFTLTPEQRQEIKDYVNRGGLLLIDAAGGSTAFADAAEKELAAIFPDAAGQLNTEISVTDPLFKSAAPSTAPATQPASTPAAATTSPAAPIDWTYRRYLREGEHRPRDSGFTGIKIKGRWAVLFTRQDMSNAFLGRDCDGIPGYSPETAAAVIARILNSLGK